MDADTLQRAYTSTAHVLAHVEPEQLDDATPCASWKVRDLINHIVGGAYLFGAVARGEPPAPGPDVADDDASASLADASVSAVAAFREPGVLERMVPSPMGEMPGAAFLQIAVLDSFVHGWDLARATGQSTDLDPELAAELIDYARGLPDALRGPDGEASFGPAVEVPESAPAADRLAGLLGRRP